jgi:hypothetical protein
MRQREKLGFVLKLLKTWSSGFLYRTEDCTLETIGKPVFKRYTPDQHGGWMMDPSPRDPEDYHKVI